MQLEPGTKLGTFELNGLIGKGGMGEVYRARDSKLLTPISLKALHLLLKTGLTQAKRGTSADVSVPFFTMQNGPLNIAIPVTEQWEGEAPSEPREGRNYHPRQKLFPIRLDAVYMISSVLLSE